MTTGVAATAFVANHLSRLNARKLMDERILPAKKHGERTEAGRDAQGLSREAVDVDDPRMAFTYGEFPLISFDALVDLSLPFVTRKVDENGEDSTERGLSVVDVGSGCGRLVLYAALSRPGWALHGIEISGTLHRIAVRAMDEAIKGGWMTAGELGSSEALAAASSSALSLHEGPANEFGRSVFRSADLVFAYSTIWPTRGFSPELRAMIIGSEWSTMLAEHCKEGCICVTTDRALDPADGWMLVERMDVDNPEVMGSTGFVQVLRKMGTGEGTTSISLLS